jgi:hypothetical protein
MPEFLQLYALGPSCFMLLQKNGFYAFEAALHIFPITADRGTGLEGWNPASLWRSEYGDRRRS